MPSSTRNLRNLNLNLNLCFSNSSTPKSKSPPTSPIATTTTNTTATSSHHHIHHKPSIMIKNFNSLYDPTLTFDQSFYSSSLSTTTTTTTSTSFESEPEPKPADFAAAFASQRFFFSCPGSSNSLIDTDVSTQQYSSSLMDKSINDVGTDEKKKEGKEEEGVLFNGSVAVPTYSPDPYVDFRRSMQEMVEARPELMDVKSNWNILHELLLCYLALNPKSTHKFILGAFADLLVSLMSYPS